MSSSDHKMYITKKEVYIKKGIFRTHVIKFVAGIVNLRLTKNVSSIYAKYMNAWMPQHVKKRKTIRVCIYVYIY